MDERKRIVIDGSNCTDMESFYNEIDYVMTLDTEIETGHNLDALHDILCGGFGVHAFGEPIEILWTDFDKSIKYLGIEQVMTIVEMMLDYDDTELDCHLSIAR